MVNVAHLCRVLLNLKILQSGCPQLCQGACAVSSYRAPQQQLVLTVPLAQAPMVPSSNTAQVYQTVNRGCCQPQPTVSWVNPLPWNNAPGYLTPVNNGSQVTYQNAIYNAPSNPNVQRPNFTFVTRAPVNIATTTPSTNTNPIYTNAPFQYSSTRPPNYQNTGMPFTPVVIPTNYPTTQEFTTQATSRNQTQFATAQDNYNRENANYTNPLFKPVVLPGSQGQSTAAPQIQSTTDSYNNLNSNYTQVHVSTNLGGNNGVGMGQTSNYNNANSGYVQQQGGQTIGPPGASIGFPIQEGQSSGGAVQQTGNQNTNYNQANAGYNLPQGQFAWNGIGNQNDNVLSDPTSGYNTLSHTEFEGTYVQNQQQNDAGIPIIAPSQLNHPGGVSNGQGNMNAPYNQANTGYQQGQTGPSENYNQANAGFSQSLGITQGPTIAHASGQGNMNVPYNQANTGYQQGQTGLSGNYNQANTGYQQGQTGPSENYNQANAGFSHSSGNTQDVGAGVASGQISAQGPAIPLLNDQGNFNLNDNTHQAYNNGNTNYNAAGQPASNGNTQSSASGSSGAAGAVAAGAGAIAAGVTSNRQNQFVSNATNPNEYTATTLASNGQNVYSTNYTSGTQAPAGTSTGVNPASLNTNHPMSTTFPPTGQKQVQGVTEQSGNVPQNELNDAAPAKNAVTNGVSGAVNTVNNTVTNISTGVAAGAAAAGSMAGGIFGTNSTTSPNVTGFSSTTLAHGDMNYQYTKNATENPGTRNTSTLQTMGSTTQAPQHIVNTSLNDSTGQSSSPLGAAIHADHADMNYQYSKNVTGSPNHETTDSYVTTSTNSGAPGVTGGAYASTVPLTTTSATSSFGNGGTQTFPGSQNDDANMGRGQLASNSGDEATGSGNGKTNVQYDHPDLNTAYGQYWSSSPTPMAPSEGESSSVAVQRDDPNNSVSESIPSETTPHTTTANFQYAAMSQVSCQATFPFLVIIPFFMFTLF